MQIDPDRISRDIEAIASFSEAPPEVGYSRPTFSAKWRAACDYVIAQAQTAGCDVRVDAAGNIHARPKSIGWDAKTWLSGSHIDSVPTGGKFDGVIGIVCALEVLRVVPDAPLELIIFAEEEGTTFGIGMIGSRLWTGEQAQLSSFRSALDKYVAAGAAHGVDIHRTESDRLNGSRYFGLIEIHIEQGPGMWRRDQRLAVVSAIAGRRQYRVTVHGQANHAGATE